MTLDMRDTVAPKSDQLNADDLLGKSLTIKITKVTGTDNAEQPVSIHYEGDNGKPYKPCKSMRRVMINVWTHLTAEYIGRSMTLYCDPKVKFGGMEVGGIRISHMSHITAPVTMALTASKANKKPFTVKPLVAERGVDVAAIKAEGDEECKGGVNGLKAWFSNLTSDEKKAVEQYKDGWKKIAADVDAQQASVDDI